MNTEWLASVIAEGQAAGSIRCGTDAQSQAMAVLAGLEGATLVGQALGSLEVFDAAAKTILAGLCNPGR